MKTKHTMCSALSQRATQHFPGDSGSVALKLTDSMSSATSLGCPEGFCSEISMVYRKDVSES